MPSYQEDVYKRQGISRIEEYFPVKDENADYDPMLQRMYKGLDQNVFTTNRQPEPIIYIEDLEVYNLSLIHI